MADEGGIFFTNIKYVGLFVFTRYTWTLYILILEESMLPHFTC